MRRDQEFLSKNQFLTFKSKHHQKTFGIYSFSSIHSYKSIVFCHWCTTYIISYHIISYHSYHSVQFFQSSNSLTNLYLLLTDLLLGHHGHHLGLLLNVVRVERHRCACKTNIIMKYFQTDELFSSGQAELYGCWGSEQLVVHRGMRHWWGDTSVVIVLVLLKIVRPELLVRRGVS